MARFVDFYPGFDPKHPFFDVFAKTRLIVGSVFGHTPRPIDVLFSGEGIKDLRHDGKFFTWGKGNWGVEGCTGRAHWFYGTPVIDHPRALSVPHYFYYWHFYRTRPADIAACADRRKKQPGISFVVSNTRVGNLTTRRIEMAVALSKWFPIHASQKLRPHFPPDANVQFHEVTDKLEFVSRYEFNLCFENETMPGYLTEKLFDALAVGAVPLYEGDSKASEWFRQGSFIDCTGLGPAQVAEKITQARAGDTMEFIDREREKLSRVSYEEMMARISTFAGAAAAGRAGLLSRCVAWMKNKYA